MNCDENSRVPGISDNEAYRVQIRKAVEACPPMPALCQQALAFMQDPDMDFSTLAKEIQFDPGITMNVLKVVNSAYFAGSEPIHSLQQALVRLGSRNLSRIIVAQGVSARLSGVLGGYDLAPQELLHHSIGVALTAERLAQHLKMDQGDGSLFTAGLLHDIGKIVLDEFVQQAKEPICALLQSTEEPFDVIEQKVLGVTHPEAGAWLMRQWHFPEDIVQIVEYHHKPLAAASQRDRALLIHLADTLVYSEGVGAGIDGFRYSVENSAAEKLGLQSFDIEQVAAEAWNMVQEMETLL
jgi:putative nucleotidyltransferase with HDIG domain